MSRARQWSLVGVVLSSGVAIAAAQSNSLMNRGQALGAPNGRATTQPVGHSSAPTGTALVVVPQAGAAMKGANPALRATSLIAVEMPEPKRVAVHDLVTIIVREDKTSVTDAKSQSDKDWKVTSGLDKWFRLNLHDQLVAQTLADSPGVEFDFKSAYGGKGKIDRKDSFTMRITARVIDVKPNGTLVVEARKKIKIDEEEQVITLTGVCRSEDVTAQNTVLSTQLADLELRAEHDGTARDAERRGFIKRIVDALRPI
ncbi:MAG: flagellar basal body L-ring protein FlgH [Phycisphaerales bacterium]|nr:flagellar basal body L-ring protein FlgH [Phycisphaerales bacterium]